jgi:hypothetical protein
MGRAYLDVMDHIGIPPDSDHPRAGTPYLPASVDILFTIDLVCRVFGFWSAACDCWAKAGTFAE